MSGFRTQVLAIQAAATSAGIKLPMAKLRDAISLALTNRRYAAAKAAESAGRLGEIALPPAHLDAACEAYALDRTAFAGAFNAVRSPPAVPLELDIDSLLSRRDKLLTYAKWDSRIPYPAFVFVNAKGRVYANPLVMDVPDPDVIRLPVDPQVDCFELHGLLTGEGRPLLARILQGFGLDPLTFRRRLDANATNARESLLQMMSVLPNASSVETIQYQLESLFADQPLLTRNSVDGSLFPAYVTLDASGVVSATVDANISPGLDPDVLYGTTLRFEVDPQISGHDLVIYLTGKGKALLERIHEGHHGDEHMGVLHGSLSPQAEAAARLLTKGLADLTGTAKPR